MRPLSEFADCRNRSQAGQDIFVLSMHNWKMNGTYLEFGAADPVLHSNTALLSDEFGWKGISVEIDGSLRARWQSRRPNDAFVVGNAIELAVTYPAERIDYLSVDIDPPEASLAVLKGALDTGTRFSVITFEHDAWRGDSRVREEGRSLLKANGYLLAVPDVKVHVFWPYLGPEPAPFEDWWIDATFAEESGIRL